MHTINYITKHSKLWRDMLDESPDDEAEVRQTLYRHMKKFTYIPKPTMDEMPSQIELHTFWLISPPSPFVITQLENCIMQGIFFTASLDIYVDVNEKYWPVVRHFTGALLKCRSIRESDFTWSMELYKRAPRHFNLTVDVCSSLECIKHAPLPNHISIVHSLECYNYLCLKQVPLSSYGTVHILETAVRNDNVELVEHLYDKDRKVHYLQLAAEHGSLNVLKFLKNKCGFWYDAAKYAVRGNQLRCLKHIYSDGGYANSSILDLAIQCGLIDCIEFLFTYHRTCDITWTSETYKPEVLEYLFAKGLDMQPLLDDAVKRGNCNVIDWAYSKGMRYVGTIADASMTVQCISCLHRHSVPWGSAMTTPHMRSVECLRYMFENGAPRDGAMENFVSRDRVEHVRYLHQHGIDWNDSFKIAVSKGSVKCLGYMIEVSAIPANAADIIKEFATVGIIEWLRVNNYPWATTRYNGEV